jgi:hypothetical protein
MKYVECKTQEELDVALKDSDVYPKLVGNGFFEIYDNSQVRACGSIQVRACGSIQVRAYGSSQVTASDNSQVTAYDSSQVTAYDSSQVTAYDNSQVRASKYVAVTKHGTKTEVNGGIQIKYLPPQNLKEWFEEYGVEPKDGVVILYKAVNSDFHSEHGGIYTPGTTPKSDKWDNGKEECGHGLHFCGTVNHAIGFNYNAKRFVACPVRVDEIAFTKNGDYPTKVKAPRVVAPGCFEVDVNGTPVKQKVSVVGKPLN